MIGKKIIMPLLAASLAASLSLTAYAGNNKTGTESGEIEEITYAFCAFTGVPSDIESVEDEINKITEEEIGVHVNLVILSASNYSEQISLMISSGEDLDMFHTLGDLSSYVSKNQVIALDDLLEEYGTDITDIESDEFINVGIIDGQLYGIPFYMGKALATTVIYRQDILDELGIDANTIQNVEDLENVFAQVSEAYPDMTMLAPLNSGDCGLTLLDNHIDYLSDSYLTPTGVLVGDSTEVVNYYATEEFADAISLARDWHDKGYISADASTTTDLASASLSAGISFCAIGGYAGNNPEAQFSAPEGASLGSVRLTDAAISTSDIQTLSRVISVSSKHPEAAMKFLNLTYTNNEVATLLLYGIEGRDYVITEDGYIDYPDGQNLFTVSYNVSLGGATSNQFMEDALLSVGSSADDIALQQEENETAWRSQAFGFTFDSSNVKTQYSTVTNVINQYLPGLRCGALDPETELPKFLEALEDAGINDIIEEKQAQLDAWLSEQ